MKGSFLNLYKPVGVTSFEVLYKVKKFFGTKKVGHMGTLDPLAEGVLPVAINEATKLIQFINTEPKIYKVKILFGFATDSFDLEKIDPQVIEGAQNESLLKSPIPINSIESFMSSLLGEFMQVPPVYSSVKIDGVRAYEKARKNEISESDLKSRKVNLFNYKILKYDWPNLEVELWVSSGFYVRSFVRDLGKFCDSDTVMTYLLRPKVGAFDLSEAVDPDNLSIDSVFDISNFKEFFVDFERLDLTEEQYKKIQNGLKLELTNIGSNMIYGFFNNDLVTIMQRDKIDSEKFNICRNL